MVSSFSFGHINPMRKWILISSMCVFFGCVLKSQHDETMAAYIKSSGDLNKTRKDSDECKQKISELEQKLSESESRSQELSESNQQLAAKNKALAEKSTDAQREYLKLIEEKGGTSQRSVWINRVSDQLSYEYRNEVGAGAVKVDKKESGLVLSFVDSSLLPGNLLDLPPKTKELLRRFYQVVKPYPEALVKASGNIEPKKVKSNASNLDVSSALGLLLIRQLEKMGLPAANLQVLAKNTNDASLNLSIE